MYVRDFLVICGELLVLPPFVVDDVLVFDDVVGRLAFELFDDENVDLKKVDIECVICSYLFLFLL